jgi:hypothetical protein
MYGDYFDNKFFSCVGRYVGQAIQKGKALQRVNSELVS